MTTKRAPRAIIYTRQSLAREETISHEIQESTCREYAARNGYEVIGVETDPGYSGRSFTKRRALKRCLEAVGAKRLVMSDDDNEVLVPFGTGPKVADVILVWRWSRLSRNEKDQQILLAMIAAGDSRVESALEPTENTPAGRLSRNVLLSFAAFESDMKAEEWTNTHNNRLEKGLPPQGRRKFGYVQEEVIGKDGKPKKGTAFVVDPATAPLVREAYRQYALGVGFGLIAEYWTKEGTSHPLGGHWDKNSVRRTLDNPFYAGIIRYKGEDKPGAHEALITEGQWAAYKAKRADRAGVAPRTKASEWPFSGLVVCGLCGAAMSRNKTVGKTKERHYLMCGRHRRNGGCAGVTVRYSDVNLFTYGWLNAHLDAWAAALPSEDEAARFADEAVSEATALLGEAQERVKSLLARAVRFDLSDEEIAEPLAQFRAEAKSAEDALTEALAAQASRIRSDDIVKYVKRGSKDVSDAEWKAGVRRVIEKVVIRPGRDWEVVPRPYALWKQVAAS